MKPKISIETTIPSFYYEERMEAQMICATRVDASKMGAHFFELPEPSSKTYEE